MIDKAPSEVTSVTTDADPVPSRLTHDAMHRRLTLGGWTPQEAGNLVARLEGLSPTRKGWTIGEIDHLLFLRAVFEAGRLPH